MTLPDLLGMRQTTVSSRPRGTARVMLNKVPEITVWFWIIKNLCATVGESFAVWINGSLGFGLMGTLYTDILTDQEHVPLRISSAVLAVGLAARAPCRSTRSTPRPAKGSTGRRSWSPSRSAPPPVTGPSS